MSVLTDEGWTTEDLYMCSLHELKTLASELGLMFPVRNVTKAEMVALLAGDIAGIVPTHDDIRADMLREATQYRAWVRGIPPAYACLTAADKRFLQLHDVPAITARAA